MTSSCYCVFNKHHRCMLTSWHGNVFCITGSLTTKMDKTSAMKTVVSLPTLSSLVEPRLVIMPHRQSRQSGHHDDFWFSVQVNALSSRIDVKKSWFCLVGWKATAPESVPGGRLLLDDSFFMGYPLSGNSSHSKCYISYIISYLILWQQLTCIHP